MSTANSKTVKGQAWVEGDSLKQEQLLMLPGSSIVSENIVSLIDNIWDNLAEEEGNDPTYGYKTNKKRYFYWEVKMTDTADEMNEVTVKVECPKPDMKFFEKIFGENIEPSEWDIEKATGSYAKYWAGVFKTADQNNKANFAIQKKVITITEGSTMDFKTGQIVETRQIKVDNNDIGDITNLLGLF